MNYFFSKNRILVCFFLATISLLIGCRPSHETKNIKAIRDLPIGTMVKIQGTVTVPSHKFHSSLPLGFGMQDATSGIYITDKINNYGMNDSVEVIGKISQDEGSTLKVVELISSKRIAEKPSIEPIIVSTGQINESIEGLLIKTSGVVDSLHDDGQYGYKIYLNDGSGAINIFVHTDTGLLQNACTWNIGDTMEATGFVAHYKGAYECAPRGVTDIKKLESE